MRLSSIILVKLLSEHTTYLWSSWWAEHSTTPYVVLRRSWWSLLIWRSSYSTSISKTNTGLVLNNSASIWRTSLSKSVMLLLEMAVSVVWLLAILILELLRCFIRDQLALWWLNEHLFLQELPLWGYGLRYKYGIFQQLISPEGDQLEVRQLLL